MSPDANFPGTSRDDLDTPALLVDLDAMESNIDRMARFVEGKPARLRPHYKAHKVPAIAHRQIRAGAIGIACAKVDEAETLVNAGIRDVLIANQVIGPKKIARLAGLARHADLMVAVDDARNVRELSEGALAAGARLRVLVEVHVGHNRCGVEPGEPAVGLAHLVADSLGLEFAGLMGYEGFCQRIKEVAIREAEIRKAMGLLLETKRLVESSGLRVGIVSAGGTGTYAVTAAIDGITEVQPGSYVLMDGYYRAMGIDLDYALTVIATVISRPAPGRAILDAGLKAITSNHGMPVVRGLPGATVAHLSEEHARIELADPSSKLEPGDRVELTPSHACTTVNLYDHLYGMRGDRLEVVWPIAGRGRVR